MLPFIVIYC